MWAGHTIAARLSVGEMSPMVMMGLRWFACLAILAFIFRHRLAAEWPRVRARFGWVAAMGGLGMAGFTFFFILAAQYTTAVNLGITQSSVPMIVMVLRLVFFGTRIDGIQIVGLLVSFMGVLVLVTGPGIEGAALGADQVDRVRPGGDEGGYAASEVHRQTSLQQCLQISLSSRTSSSSF